MKVYPTNINQPVNSVQRQPESIVIPVFQFAGTIKAGTSDKWYPTKTTRLTGGYVTVTTPGTSDVAFAIMKYNIFEQTAGNLSLAGVLPAGDIKTKLYAYGAGEGPFFGNVRDPGNMIISTYDWISVTCFIMGAGTAPKGATLQLTGVKAN